MPHLNFYTTAHCSLCDQAFDLLLGTPELTGYQVCSIDIADDAELFERFGTRIPVLEINGQQLCAPIDKDALLHWLDEIR